MKLRDLKASIDSYIGLGHEEDPVLITLSQPSIGSRASCGIRGIYPGFDWEHGQMRIEPDKPIVTAGRSKDDMKPMAIYAYSAPRPFYNCPTCGKKVKKDDNYCSRCGQHIFYNKNAKPADSYRKED